MNDIARPLFRSLLATVLLTGCQMTGPTALTPSERAIHGAFQRDRALCQRVVEQTTPYVDPADAAAVAARSYRIEGEIQKCMLSRGWNDPKVDGWTSGQQTPL